MDRPSSRKRQDSQLEVLGASALCHQPDNRGFSSLRLCTHCRATTNSGQGGRGHCLYLLKTRAHNLLTVSPTPDHPALSAARTQLVDVEEREPEAMDVKERKPYRSLTRRRDAERRYTSSSADSEEGKGPQKSYSSSETLKAYDQDARLAYSGRVKDMVPQEAEEFCRTGEGGPGTGVHVGVPSGSWDRSNPLSAGHVGLVKACSFSAYLNPCSVTWHSIVARSWAPPSVSSLSFRC